MTKADAFLFFILSWITFILTGFIIGNTTLLFPEKYWTPILLVSPIITLSLSYCIIWLLLIKKKYTFFDWKDFKNFNSDLFLPITLMVVGIQIIEQPFVDFYNDLFYPELSDLWRNQKTEININLLFSSITAILIAPIFEELLFRKIIFRQLLRRNSLWTSVTLSSLMFALVHIPLYGKIIPTFLIGVLSALIFFKTGKIIYSIIFHFVNNFLAMTWDFYLPDFWNNYRAMEFNINYWLICLTGVFVLWCGGKLFLRKIEKSRENL